MPGHAIHITGASGAGTTTLGRALAARLKVAHFDTDDFYWLPVEPAYSIKRPAAERLSLLGDAFDEAGSRGWVLSGSTGDWGASLVPLFDVVVFLRTPADIRLARLRAREATQFGATAVAPGGWRYKEHEAFLKWSADYDAGTTSGRNLARHEVWLAKLDCPVLRLDGSEPASLLAILRELESLIFKPEVRRDRAKLDALAHPDFFEFGTSGKSYSRSDILELLPLDQSGGKVWAQDWSVQPLGEGYALLTYKSAHELPDGSLERHALRSSVWSLTAQGWQLRFHQGTPTEAFEKAK